MSAEPLAEAHSILASESGNNTSVEENNSFSSTNQAGSTFLYLPVKFNNIRVAALLDTGSSINLMSSDLFYSISKQLKSELNVYDRQSLLLANDQKIDILGTATVEFAVRNSRDSIFVYILESTSNPLILGTQYLKENNIVLDFSCLSVGSNEANVRSVERITIPPNTEIIVTGKLPDNILPGLQGVCTGTKFVHSKNLFTSKALVTVSADNTVPVKLLNAGNAAVTINRGKI